MNQLEYLFHKNKKIRQKKNIFVKKKIFSLKKTQQKIKVKKNGLIKSPKKLFTSILINSNQY